MLPTDHWSVAQRRRAKASEGPAAMAAWQWQHASSFSSSWNNYTYYGWPWNLVACSRAFLNWLAWDHIRVQTKAQNRPACQSKIENLWSRITSQFKLILFGPIMMMMIGAKFINYPLTFDRSLKSISQDASKSMKNENIHFFCLAKPKIVMFQPLLSSALKMPLRRAHAHHTRVLQFQKLTPPPFNIDRGEKATTKLQLTRI